MRRILPILTLVAAAAFATSALARQDYLNGPAAPELGAGAVAGTVAGVGIYNGWWGATAAGAALPTTAAGAAALGGVAGVGTVALIDSVVQPCRGFQALFGLNKDECVDGTWVGPHRFSEVPRRRIVR